MHETGIYLSIGIRKAKILLQHIVECLLIATVAFFAAWGISGLAAKPIGDMVLQSIPEEQQEKAAASPWTELYNDPVDIDYSEQRVEELDTAAGLTEWLIIVGAESVVILLSVGLSSIMMIRMKPKDILSSIE